MALSRSEIVKRSEEKHGIKLKGFKLPLTTIAKIEQLSKQLDIPQNQLIIQAVELFEQAHT
ncbi:ribbon-helix-helix protein, CopG family [Avibacterium sp. 21-599]|uniref:ribbon-helix-helix protein, CopG family n=1 Tax=Avibacterium sp. 21-599 TaxID=2911528 RepID=UPI002245F2CC|nr:ribbon-helix-helix protein, CopG family [Avibacterium sp. 21-599]MCW9717385.1 ribbon-helix-helix protein, CopG family [Avibacterium sp. 21-599]